jgi:hypothetical protein
MARVVDRFVQTITRFPNVQETEGDMFGERSFRVSGKEFLHVHGSSTLHLLLPREVKAEAIARGQAREHPYAPQSRHGGNSPAAGGPAPGGSETGQAVLRLRMALGNRP